MGLQEEGESSFEFNMYQLDRPHWKSHVNSWQQWVKGHDKDGQLRTESKH